MKTKEKAPRAAQGLLNGWPEMSKKELMKNLSKEMLQEMEPPLTEEDIFTLDTMLAREIMHRRAVIRDYNPAEEDAAIRRYEELREHLAEHAKVLAHLMLKEPHRMTNARRAVHRFERQKAEFERQKAEFEELRNHTAEHAKPMRSLREAENDG